MAAQSTGHTPVLLPEVLAALNIQGSGVYLDATFGRGGHAGAIMERLIEDGRLLCLDRDSAAIAEAQARFGGDPRVRIFLAPFSQLARCVEQVQAGLKVNGILMDLGVSSPQLDDASRGFSFAQDGPLDMRMNAASGPSAADVVNGASEHELIRIFRDFGEERFAPRIARAIIADRRTRPFLRTLQLAEMIARVARSNVSGGVRHKHPATQVFQALRIYVNRELEELQAALDAALECLAPRGRLAVISFHSLEDRIVKQFMQRHSVTDPIYAGFPEIPAHVRPRLKRVGKSLRAGDAEIARNPRARSARLRVCEFVDRRAAA